MMSTLLAVYPSLIGKDTGQVINCCMERMSIIFIMQQQSSTVGEQKKYQPGA